MQLYSFTVHLSFNCLTTHTPAYSYNLLTINNSIAFIQDNGERLTMQIQLHNPLLLPALESLLSHLTLMLKKHQSFLSRIESAYKNYNQMTTVGGIIWQHVITCCIFQLEILSTLRSILSSHNLCC